MLIKKPSPTSTPTAAAVSAELEHRSRNDRQSYIAIARAIAHAQFVLADPELSRRLWQDVADRDLEVSRILHLLYGGWDLDTDEEMQEADCRFLTLKQL